MSKRVAIFLPNLTGGGAERVALATAADLVEGGHAVDLILVEAYGDLVPLVPPGVRVVDLKAPRIIAALPPLVRYLRAERPDALHAVMWPVTVIAIMAHRLARSVARLVVSDHTTLSRHVSDAVKKRLLKWTTRIFYPLADARTICSRAAADDLAELSGIKRDRIEVIYNPVSLPGRIATNAAVEAMWGECGPRIITVGNLKPEKNQALLLRALAEMSDKTAKLMILGQGPLHAALGEQADQLGITDRVVFAGFVIDPWPFLASADLFVLSSDYEGFGIALVEAMLTGLSVVSTDCGGPREILADGQFGRLVPCGDAKAMARAIHDSLAEPAQVDRLRRRAAELAGSSAIIGYRQLLLPNQPNA